MFCHVHLLMLRYLLCNFKLESCTVNPTLCFTSHFLPLAVDVAASSLISNCFVNTEKCCPADWVVFSSSCYLLSNDSGSWEEAEMDCKHRGALLVVVNGTKEQVHNKEIHLLVVKCFKQVSNKSLKTRDNWRNNQPDNGGGSSWTGDEDCAHIRSDSEWNDLSCEISLQWICEKML
uniref:C-type lectin domain-containing protein n=1 Tax=Anabas testudineus TaxID=64144 RepID=A0A3Q1JTJ6_ANATE